MFRENHDINSYKQIGLFNTVTEMPRNRNVQKRLDWLVHHAHILAFDGPSYRLQQALSTIPNCSNSPFKQVEAGEQ